MRLLFLVSVICVLLFLLALPLTPEKVVIHAYLPRLNDAWIKLCKNIRLRF